MPTDRRDATTFAERLRVMNACSEAVEWCGDRTLERAWNECERADWLMWLASKHLPRSTVMLAACDCAETALRYVPEGEDRPRRAIEVARRYHRGEATGDELEAARAEARAAAREAGGSAARAEARAAARAAACDATWTVEGAAEWAVLDTAWAAAGGRTSDSEAWAAPHRQMCNLIRKRITAEMVAESMDALLARTQKDGGDE